MKFHQEVVRETEIEERLRALEAYLDDVSDPSGGIDADAGGAQ